MKIIYLVLTTALLLILVMFLSPIVKETNEIGIVLKPYTNRCDGIIKLNNGNRRYISYNDNFAIGDSVERIVTTKELFGIEIDFACDWSLKN